MDIFNKKKVKELKEIIHTLNHDIEGYQKNERHWNSQIDELEKISINLTNENQKLIQWIFKILDTFGTVEVKERHIQIPIIKELNYRSCENFDFVSKEERITIPTITFIKMG